MSRQTLEKKQKAQYQAIGKGALEYFQKALKAGALNAYPLYTLLLAEQSPNKKAFDEAIKVCSRTGLSNFEAMANEGAALFFFKEGDKDWGMYYMEKALELYDDWGATGKAKLLRLKYGIEEGGDHRGRGSNMMASRGYFRKSMVLGKLTSVNFNSSLNLFSSSGERGEAAPSSTMDLEKSDEMSTKSRLGALKSMFSPRNSGAKDTAKRESACTVDTINTNVF